MILDILSDSAYLLLIFANQDGYMKFFNLALSVNKEKSIFNDLLGPKFIHVNLQTKACLTLIDFYIVDRNKSIEPFSFYLS